VDEVELDTIGATDIDSEGCQEKKRKILQLLEDNGPLLSDDFTTATISDVDFAVSENDLSGLDVILDEVKAELKRDRIKQSRDNVKESMAELKMKPASEIPNIADNLDAKDEQLEIF
jgi:hypothetical protein